MTDNQQTKIFLARLLRTQHMKNTALMRMRIQLHEYYNLYTVRAS